MSSASRGSSRCIRAYNINRSAGAARFSVVGISLIEDVPAGGRHDFGTSLDR